jgi:hypothetical protein
MLQFFTKRLHSRKHQDMPFNEQGVPTFSKMPFAKDKLVEAGLSPEDCKEIEKLYKTQPGMVRRKRIFNFL